MVRVGDGSAPLTTDTTPVFLERRAIATGALVSTLPLPTTTVATNLPFTLVGTASPDGALSRSPDGRRLALLGYQSAPGTASTAINGLPRVVGLIDASDFGPAPSIETNTTIGTAYAMTAPRGAVVNGTNIWLAGGTSGVFLTTPGSSSIPVNVATAPGSLRAIGIFGGDIFVSSGTMPAGLYQVGTGLPLVSSTSSLVVATTSPYSFAVFDLNPTEPGLDTIYLVDDSGGGGIKRFTRAGGAWGATAAATLGPPVRQAACVRDGLDVLCVASSSTTLYRLRDLNAALPSSQSALTVIGSAPTNTGFRGVAFAPAP